MGRVCLWINGVQWRVDGNMGSVDRGKRGCGVWTTRRGKKKGKDGIRVAFCNIGDRKNKDECFWRTLRK